MPSRQLSVYGLDGGDAMDIKLPDDLATQLKARAEAEGRDPEAYTVGLLWRAVVELDPPRQKTKKKRNKTPVESVVSDHDWTEFFRFAEPSDRPPTPEQLFSPGEGLGRVRGRHGHGMA